MPAIVVIILMILFALICVMDFIYVRWMRIMQTDIEMLMKRMKHLEGKIMNMDDKIDRMNKD